jgi:hypothetical protein
MVPGKLETGYSMGLLEERTFLLDNGLKIILSQCPSDCLRMDRAGDDVVNEMGSLNSIVKLPSGDLASEGLFVSSRELGRMASYVVFLVPTHLPFDSANG